MNRLLPLGLLGALLLLALPASACGGGGQGEDTQYCHDYTIHTGSIAGNSLDANEKGQFLLTADASLVSEEFIVYVEQDVDYADPENPWLMSLWIYFETNGQPGLQRGDEVCNNTPEGQESDSIIC